MSQFTYLAVDIGCVLLPFLASFYTPHPFYKHWKAFFLGATIMAIPFLIWDEIFTTHGVWGFEKDYLTGVYMGHLPLEEILFFYCIPYACVFTYFALGYLIKNNPLQKFQLYIHYALLLCFIGFVLMGYNKWYPFITGLFGVLLMSYILIKKPDFSYGYVAYLFIYPFFIISNGVLTGSGLSKPVVWYNNAENFGIRMGTIPLEDSFYGFILIAGNILLFQYFKKKDYNTPYN